MTSDLEDAAVQGAASTRCQAGRVDVLIALYQQENAQARQHEVQRERMTSLILLTAGAVLTVLAANRFKVEFAPLAVFLIFLGWFGQRFSLKHYERFRYHHELARRLVKLMDAETSAAGSRTGLAEMSQDVFKEHEQSGFAHYGDTPRERRRLARALKWRTFRFWARLNMSVAWIGVALLALMVYREAIARPDLFSRAFEMLRAPLGW